jgi:urocanate hydratase
VDLWERLAERNIHVDMGSDQTSLHNPWAGGYYPVGLSYEESNKMMAGKILKNSRKRFMNLRRHVAAINDLSARGMYFFDYGNAFLLESGRAGADIFKEMVNLSIHLMFRILWAPCVSIMVLDLSAGYVHPANRKI